MDIATDLDAFVLKFVKNSDQVTPLTDLEDLEYEIRSVPHYWRNRISFSTSQVMEKAYEWDWILHKRIARYFRLYTQILNF